VRGDVRLLLRLLEADEFLRSPGEPHALVLLLDEEPVRGDVWLLLRLLKAEEFFCSRVFGLDSRASKLPI
jgi:hypothetical protein